MNKANNLSVLPDDLALNFHLMHPGGDSVPGDPNAAFCLDGTYHLHYILQHPWQDNRSFCFVHVTSTDMLHWTWQATKLQMSFTGHGMYSGTGFITKEGCPAVIYHGQGSGRNQIAIAKDNCLSEWQKPYPVEPTTADGKPVQMLHWDPDCFLIGGTYYAISGGQNPPLFKSQDLVTWTFVGDFLKHDFPEVAFGEDISCPNFFRLGNKWMLICISHPFGCRYYLGDWDAEREQFVPQVHGRMNWQRPDQPLYDTRYADIFAPESLLTPDGRRVMWAWFATLDDSINEKTVQSLPRELSLGADGSLRIRPLRELESLRREPVTLTELTVTPPECKHGGMARRRIADLDGDAFEIRITVDRAEALRKRFGFQLFAGEDQQGLPLILHPETGTCRIGMTEVPFSVADLAADEDLVLHIFIDKYLVELFVSDRQAAVAVHMDNEAANGLYTYSFGAPTTIRTVQIWRLEPANQGFHEARQRPLWEPDIALD
jgi:sucrose-6-phosphate hydrolase SacC (GH32 family)